MSCYVLEEFQRRLVDSHLPSQINYFSLFQITPSKFLGLAMQVPKDIVSAQSKLKSLLQSMPTAVDEAPPTHQETEAQTHSLGIRPRLNWLLSINEFPMPWIERHLEALATRYLKKWPGMTRHSNILHIPRAEGGLNLPAIFTLYKKFQVSKQCQLLTSNDSTVRHLAEKNLES